MDIQTLECVIEILGAVLIALGFVVIKRWAALKQSLITIGETTRANRTQWVSILASILGANFGFIIPVGAYTIFSSSGDQAYSQSFLFPATVAIYLICAVPIYIPVGVICGLLIYRFVQRKGLGGRINFILSVVISVVIGAIIAIPIYFIGLLGAAI